MKNKLLLLLLLLVSLTMNSQISIVDFEEDSPGVSDTNQLLNGLETQMLQLLLR